MNLQGALKKLFMSGMTRGKWSPVLNALKYNSIYLLILFFPMIADGRIIFLPIFLWQSGGLKSLMFFGVNLFAACAYKMMSHMAVRILKGKWHILGSYLGSLLMD